MLLRTHPRVRGSKRWKARGGFDPRQLSAVSSWWRLQASSQSGGEWVSFSDVITSGFAIPNAARRPAVATSANGLPLANFQSDDSVPVTIAAATLNRDTVGYFMWVAPDAIPASSQQLLAISTGAGAATGTFLTSFLFSDVWFVAFFVDAVGNGRTFQVANAAAAGVGHVYGIEYDSSVGGDGCVTLSIDGAIQTTVKSDVGAGGTLGTLPSVTGSILIANSQNAAASPSTPGKFGPNTFILTSKMAGATQGLLTSAARQSLTRFEVPT